MNNTIKKISVFIVAFTLVFSMFAVSQVSASGTTDAGSLLWGGQKDNIQGSTGLGEEDPQVIAANIIRVILGFLGILAVVLILFGGFKWMTAAGNEDKVAEAKKLLIAGVIGLIIILAAFSLAAFVLNALFEVTDAGN